MTTTAQEVFYRVHSTEYPFDAEHAWSSSPGLARSEDGSQYECECTITGTGWEGCEECDGTGWASSSRGYSCCWDAEDLLRYFEDHLAVSDSDRVILFTGEHVGTGPDGEPLVIPMQVISTMTWDQFTSTSL